MNNNPRSSVASSRNWGAFEIALLYLTIGVLWILFSDEAAARLAPNQAVLTQISIYKGWGYVLVTALLLYWMIRLHTRRINQTKLTLSESEKSYQELLQQASDGILITDAKGQYTLVNEEACRLLGYTKEEILSLNLQELVAPEDLKKTPLRLDELQAGKTLITERKLLRKDGSRIVCEISAKLLADGRYQSIIRDITERKVTDEALVRSEQRYRSLFENMTNGFARCQMLYDENGAPKDFIYLDINQTFEKLTGLKNVLGKRISAVIPGIYESNPELLEIYGRVALTGKPEKFETYVPGLGAGIWFSVSVYSTEKNFFVTVFDVITERKQAETALRENEERLRLSLHAANQGLYDLNVQTGDAVVNREYAEMLGYDFDCFVETNAAWIERLHPDDREITANTYTNYVNGLTPEYRVEFRQKTKAGDWKWILSLGKVADYDATGQPLRMLGTHTDITERKQAEAKLRHSEEQYRLMFTNNPQPMWVFDRETFAFLAVNDATVAQYGYSREEFLQMTIKDIRPPEDIPAMVNVAATNSEPYFNTGIWKHRKKDGTLIDVEITRHDILFDGHEALIILANDITERKQAEALQTQLAAIVDSSDDAIIGKTLEGVITSWNVGAERLYGYSAAEVIGQSISLLFPADRKDELFEILTKLKRGERIKHFETERQRKNGTRLFVSLTISPIKDAIGQITGASTIARDITERKQAEAELRQSQENFAKAFNSNPAAIAITRLTDGKFININPAYTRIMDYEPAEILNRTTAEMNIYVHPEERAQVIQQLREQGTVQNHELLVRAKSGETRSLVICMEPLLYNDEECILSVFLDISERKKMELELQHSNTELEQFAYVASHDLQEPLRAVAGMVQLLQQRYQGKLDERADEYIGHAVEASRRMQKLINDLLDYSRIGRLGKPFESIDSERSLNAALTNLQVVIQESQAQITHDPLPSLMGDATQLTQMLQNLIGNAIKFRGERPLHIHISAKKIEQAWQFEVSDNGIGIEPKYYERIFLVFQRLHTRREYPGTGIGLALCKKIVERHHGQIWVESQPGLGSTFYFTIPERQP